MRPARRLDSLPMYFFAELATRIKKLQEQGLDVIRLDIGGPDGPPASHIIEALNRNASDSSQHGYSSYGGTRALRRAWASYYAQRFSVDLDIFTEIVPLIGSKEGIANMALAWLDPGDLALVTDPCYPTYRLGAFMAGADVWSMPLLADRDFLPDLSRIPGSVAERARLLWLNYPNNPTGAVASLEFFAEVVSFCRRHEILLCHDAPYADVCFDGYRAPSLLSIPGAKDVAVEFNSVSKSHSMAGWRVGVAAGNRVAIQALMQIKSNIDSGIFLPIQAAAVEALTGDQDWTLERNAEYQRRRDILYDVFAGEMGLACKKPRAGLYLWPRTPESHTSAQAAERILLETGVSLTSGSEYGENGEGYLRVSIGQTTGRIMEAADRLRRFRF